MSAVDAVVRVEVSCPSCGAEGYEFDFDAGDIESGTEVSVPCDECPKRVAVWVDVSVHSLEDPA